MSSFSLSSNSSLEQEPLLAEITRVCEAATTGNLEPRVLGSSQNPDLVKIANAINSLLDSTDVYVRESTASLIAASEGRYYRRVLDRGMQGTFRSGAKLLNHALTEMKGQAAHADSSESERTKMVLELEQTLSESAQRISNAIQSISKITRNTHLLAMNAKIEAAGAGEAGKGFAIVAHEVELISHKVNQAMAEIDRVFAEFKVETHTVLQHVANRKAA